MTLLVNDFWNIRILFISYFTSHRKIVAVFFYLSNRPTCGLHLAAGICHNVADIRIGKRWWQLFSRRGKKRGEGRKKGEKRVDGAVPCHQGGKVADNRFEGKSVTVDKKSISTLRNHENSGYNRLCGYIRLFFLFFFVLCLGIRRLKRTDA